MSARLLVVEDDPAVLHAFSTVLGKAGFDVETAATGADAIAALGERAPDVVVCDYMLPVLDGLAVLAETRRRHPDSEFVLLTAYASVDVAVQALKLGACDFLVKPLPSLDLLVDRVRRAVERLELRRRLAHMLEIAKARSLATARIVAGVLDLYDPSQGGHAKRVAALAKDVGRAAGLDDDALLELEIAATLHDLGYLALPPARARRPIEELRADEAAIVREHPVLGETLVGGVEQGGAMAALVRHHHEQWDGGGFPDGLAGEAIPLGARILAACEAYDEHLAWPAAGTTPTPASAAELLRRGRGRAFDPEIVDLLLAVTGRGPAPHRELSAVSLSRLEEGMILAKPIYTIHGLMLLPEGQVLTEQHIARIRNFHRVHPIADRIWIYRPAS